jgi:hypothetical protein
VRDGLIELAERVEPAAGYEDRVFRRARRLRTRRRLAAGATSALCLAVIVTMFRLVWAGPAQPVAVPPDGPFLGWPPVGSVDEHLVREATEVWDRAEPAGPHTAVRTLVATSEQYLHAIVVLQGYNNQGAARLAFFTSDTSAADALRMRADRPAPDPVSTKVISLVSPRLTGPAGAASNDYWGTFAIALAMPGVTAVRVSTPTIDQELVGAPDAPTSRLVVSKLSLAATPPSTLISGFVEPRRVLAKPTKVFEEPADYGADGDARAVPAEVVRRTGQQFVVALRDDQAVRPGQLAVVPEGLVGRVTAVDALRGEATIDLVTSAAFTGEVYTNISNVPGTVRGTGKKLMMERTRTGGDVYQGNRVLIPDPAQRNDHVGAVTIGRASDDLPADSSAVELTPTADLAHVHKVSIMTPFTAGVS